MPLPLYYGCTPPASRPATANTGLWYDKFCNKWGKGWRLGEDKLGWIQTVAGNDIGEAGRLEEAVGRLCRLAGALGGVVGFFKTTGRVVTGLGREHPVGNGFAWHQTLGVPYLPGSSVKGVVRSWAENWWEECETGEGKETARRVFGSTQGGTTQRVGSVIFFDALPAQPIRLEAEVMTPHYGPYYRNGEPPADYYSPEPIPFLTVAKEQVFVFVLATSKSGGLNDVHLAMEWLGSALAETGVGAKTAVGYGRFEPDQSVAEMYQAIIAPVEVTPETGEDQEFRELRQEMEEDGYGSDSERFMKALTEKWLKRMNQPEIPQERCAIASLLAAWYQRYRAEQWAKPIGKNMAKVNEIRNALADQK